MTRHTPHEIERRLDGLEDSKGPSDAQDFWKRSAAEENPLDDPDYAKEMERVAEQYGRLGQWFQ